MPTVMLVSIMSPSYLLAATVSHENLLTGQEKTFTDQKKKVLLVP